MPRFLLPLFLIGSLAASAADRLFVFGESGAATIFDADGLNRVGAAEAVPGATAAFRAFRGNGARYYVVGGAGVAVLDETFGRVGTIPFDSAGERPRAAFDEGAGRLVVTAGRTAYLIDTEAEQVAAATELGFRAQGVAVVRGTGRALVLGADARSVWEIDLETGEASGPTSALPAAADALAASASGGRVTAASGRGLFELRGGPIGGTGGLGGAATMGSVLAVDDAGGAVWRVGDELRVLSADGAEATTLTDPGTGKVLGEGVVDVAMSDGTVLALTADGRLLRFGKDGALEVLLDAPGAALALTGGGEKEQGTPAISMVFGNGQSVTSGAAFSLVVMSNFGTPLVLKTTETGGAVCADDVPIPANQQAAINCTAPTVGALTAVTVTVQAFAGATPLNPALDFQITVITTGQDGLSAASSTNVTIAPDTDVDLIVQAIENGLPKSGVNVTASDDSQSLTCEASDTTGQDGRATITCTSAANVPAQTTAMVTISGLGDDVVFSVTITASGAPMLELIRETPSVVNVFEGASASLGIRTLTSGAARPNVTVSITVTPGVVVCANTVATGLDGRTTILCQTSQVTANQSVTVTASEGGRSVQFTVNVLDSAQANGLTKISGDNQLVGAGTAFPNNLVVSATVAGTPQPGLKLTILPDSTLVFCDTTIVTDSQGLGTFQCNAGSVPGLTNVTIQVRDDSQRQLPQPFQATIVPGSVGQADDVILLSQAQLTLPANTPVPNAIRARALDGGQPAAGAAVFFTSNQNVTFQPAAGTTNVNGETSTTVTVPCSPSSGTIRVSISQAPSATDKTVSYTRTSGGFTQIQKLNGDNQTASAGQTFARALLVQTSDSCGQGVGNQPLTWQVIPPGAATLVNIVGGGLTNQSGQASTQVRAGAIGGPFTVRATSGAQTADFMLTVTNNPTVLQALSGGGQSIPRGETSAEPLVARVLNDAGNAVPGVPVTFRVVSGAATLNQFAVQTDAAGRAEVFVTAGGTRGPAVIEASAINQTVRFTVMVVGDQPVFETAGVTNGASFRTGLVPGSAASIFGTGIAGDVSGAVTAPFPFPLEFRGVQVLINNVPAPIFALIKTGAGEQINFQVPFTIAASTTATVTIVNNGAQSQAMNVPVYSIQPGIFQYFPGGEAQAHAAALDANFNVIGPTNAVPPGGLVQLFVTGLGAVTPPATTNVPGGTDPIPTVNAPVTVGLNNAGVPILGAFYAPGLVSVYQINFLVPTGLAPGTYQLSIVADGIGSQTVLLVVGAPPPSASE